MLPRALLFLATALACAAPLVRPLGHAVDRILASGASELAVDSLLTMPVGVLGIVILRTVVGLETFGLFAPLLLGFAFERIGPVGPTLFLLLLLVATPVRLLLERVPFLSVARTGVLVVCCAILVLFFTAYGAPLIPGAPVLHVGLPIVLLAGMIDRFVTAQMDQSPGEAIRLSGYTLVTAILISRLLGWEALRSLLRAAPDLLWLILPLCLLFGRFSGLRLLELWRFRRVAQIRDSV